MMSRTTILTTTALVVLSVSMAVGGWAWARETSGAQDLPTVPQLIAAFEPEWTDEQESILEDGVITREEYAAATDRVAECLEGYGLTVQREQGMGPGGIDLLSTESPASSGDPRSRIMDCYERYRGKLAIIWAEQNRPTADQLAERAADINTCLSSRDVTPKPLEELNEEERTVYMVCLMDVGPPGAAR